MLFLLFSFYYLLVILTFTYCVSAQVFSHLFTVSAQVILTFIYCICTIYSHIYSLFLHRLFSHLFTVSAQVILTFMYFLFTKVTLPICIFLFITKVTLPILIISHCHSSHYTFWIQGLGPRMGFPYSLNDWCTVRQSSEATSPNDRIFTSVTHLPFTHLPLHNFLRPWSEDWVRKWWNFWIR